MRQESACEDKQHLESDMETDDVGDSTVENDDASGWVSASPQMCTSDMVERELLRLFIKMHVLLHVPQ